MKTYKVLVQVMERYEKSGDLLVDIDGDETIYDRRALIKESNFEINDPNGDTLEGISEETSVMGYVHAQIVDENADSLLLNLPHPYTGEDNLFRVEKETEEEVEEEVKNFTNLVDKKELIRGACGSVKKISINGIEFPPTSPTPPRFLIEYDTDGAYFKDLDRAAEAGANARDQAIEIFKCVHRRQRKEVAEKDFRDLRDYLIEKASPDRQPLPNENDYARYLKSLPNDQLEWHAAQLCYYKPMGVTVEGFRKYLFEQIKKEGENK